MPKSIYRAKAFKSRASHPLNGLSVIFDLGGFSKFFNQPDVHSYIPSYLNHITKCIETAFFGGKQFWLLDGSDDLPPLNPLPIHRKFLGDGALYIWTPSKTSEEFSTNFLGYLSNRLWNLQKELPQINKACADQIPVFELPKAIRFGISRGTIYELTIEGSKVKEYIGICINLAARLQKYCSGLNFIASARVGLPSKSLTKHGYIKVLATKIKGFPNEIVIVDKDEYQSLPKNITKDLFADI